MIYYQYKTLFLFLCTIAHILGPKVDNPKKYIDNHGLSVLLKEKIGMTKEPASPQREIIVAIVDTGVDYNSPFIKDNIYTINGEPKIIDLTGNNGVDDHGHGTQIASAIIALYPRVKIVPIKVFDKKLGRKDFLREGILLASLIKGVEIINISASGFGFYEEEKEIIQSAIDRGISVVVSAGNHGMSLDKFSAYPASHNSKGSFITVAGEDGKGISKFSNYSSHIIDFSIAGTEIPVRKNNGMVRQNGTSYASAIVSGLCAIIKSTNPHLSPAQVREILSNSTERRYEGTRFGTIVPDRLIRSLTKKKLIAGKF